MTNALREGDWTPDEILLTIWAHHEIAAGAQREAVIASLAEELRRHPTAVDAALSAVDGGAARSRVLAALHDGIGDDRREVRRLAENIRELWRQTNRL